MKSISEIRQCVDNIRKFIDILEGDRTLLQQTLAESAQDDYLEELTDLRQLLRSPAWPAAIEDVEQICNQTSEEDKKDRAEGIVESLIGGRLPGARVLDFGCGEGHITRFAQSKNPSFILGYDIKSYALWDSTCTTDFLQAVNNKPYDIIFIYDVLDHVIDEKPVEILGRLQSLLGDTGVMIIRFHPWCSRHGGHLYHEENKAFVHLIFTDEELERLGITTIPMRQITMPTDVYEAWFVETGLKIATKREINDSIEAFFSMGVVEQRIGKLWDSLETAKRHMSLSFVDYILAK